MKQVVKFTFEGFEIEAKFSKDSEPPYDNWELDDWKLVNDTLHYFSFKMLNDKNYNFDSLNEKVEAACYEALENYDPTDDIFEE